MGCGGGAEDAGEKDGVVSLVVDQVDERMVGVEDGGFRGPAGAEAEDRGGRGRGGTLLRDLDAGAVYGVTEVQARLAVRDKAAEIGHPGYHEFTGAQGVQQLADRQLLLELETWQADLDLARR